MSIFKLPLLPFSCTFDILIRHDGFAGFDTVYGRRASLYRFWELFSNHASADWIDAICTCRLVQALSDPAHALFLLVPTDFSVRPSVVAWDVAKSRRFEILTTSYVVLAMKCFLSLDREVFPWLSTSDIVLHNRTPAQWIVFAKYNISSYHFTRRWWNEQPEVPLSDDWSAMGHVVVVLAREESELLVERLRCAERKKCLCLKKKKIGDEKSRKKQHKITITKADQTNIDAIVQGRRAELTTVLNSVCTVFAEVPQSLLEHKYDLFARYVAGTVRLYPHIKWSVLLAFHTASRGRRTSWAVERAVWGQMHCKDKNPVRDLKALVVEKK
jgi:hypothetical protein